MKKSLPWTAVLIVLVAVVLYVSTKKPVGVVDTSIAADYKNATYIIEGQPVTLRNGVAEMELAPGSASKLVTRYFGNEAFGDLNGDGVDDVAFLLTQTAGGTGTFYYAVVALKTAGGYHGTNGIFLGDRVAPQTTELRNGQIIVNYAERKPDDPMAARPSVGVSKYLHLEGLELKEGARSD
jgi:hypothetical protein